MGDYHHDPQMVALAIKNDRAAYMSPGSYFLDEKLMECMIKVLQSVREFSPAIQFDGASAVIQLVHDWRNVA